MTANGVTRLADAALPSRYGDFRVVIFRVDGSTVESPALIYGNLRISDSNVSAS